MLTYKKLKFLRSFSITTTFRIFSFALNLLIWCWFFSDGPHSLGLDPHPESWGGRWRFLTFWGLSINLIMTGGALLSEFKLVKFPTWFCTHAVIHSTVVIILYWSLVAIDPHLVRVPGRYLPWYIEYHVHLLSGILCYFEAFKLTGCFKELKKDLIMINVMNAAYISWIEFVIFPLSGHPCNKAKTVCGFPYPFLNEIPTSERIGLYVFSTVFVLMFYFFIRKTILHFKNTT